MNKIRKLIISVLCMILLINFTYLFGYTAKADFISDAESFGKSGKEINDVTTSLVPIGRTLTSVGIGVLVIATIYLGIMYFISGPEAQGKLKGQLFGLVAAAVVIFGAYGIWSIAIDLFKDFKIG